jgi:SPOR domain
MASFTRIKNHAATAAIIAAAMVACLGVMAFVLALRPSYLSVPAGDIISYRLRVTTNELIDHPDKKDVELPATISEQDVHIIGVGGTNEAMVLTTINQIDQVALLSFARNGAARRLDAAARAADAGVAIGLFDFNLTPLPPGSEQIWTVDVPYAVLPPAKRMLQGKARRLRSGSSPEFQLKLPASVEWIGDDGRYRQIRDLVSAYRFNSRESIIEHADIRCIAGFERPSGHHRYKVRLELEFIQRGRTTEDPTQIRNLALAGMDAQTALEQQQRERLAGISERLMAASIQDPRLRQVAQRFIAAMRNPPKPAEKTLKNTYYAVHLASCAAEQRTDAQRFVAHLASLGFRAYIAEEGQTLAILVGPYLDRDPMVLRTLSQRFPQQRVQWVAVQP